MLILKGGIGSFFTACGLVWKLMQVAFGDKWNYYDI